MWFFAVAAGIALLNVSGYLAKRVFRAGRKTLGRLIEFVRWPVFMASIRVAIGLSRHETAWTLVWYALVVIAGGLTGRIVSLFVIATSRTYRILRHRRNNAIP